MKIGLKYVVADPDRHGNERYYFRRRGFLKVRLPGEPGSDLFFAAYRAALAAVEAGRQPGEPEAEISPNTRLPRPQPGTLRWIVAGYVASATFTHGLDAKTQRVRRNILEKCCQEPIAPDETVPFGEMPIAHFTARMVRILRDRKLSTPEAANARIKALRQAFGWAMEFEHAKTNPAMEVKYVSNGSDGWHTWTEEEVEQYRSCWPLGTKPRLAFEILLLLGVRRSDAVRLGRQHRRGDTISFKPKKGSRRKPQSQDLPILPDLATAIEAGPVGDLTWIVTHTGKPYTAEGFGNWFRRQCDKAGLPHCSAHGLRKAGSTFAAENGADPFQLMAIYGWRTLKEAERYCRAARQKKLAAEGMSKIQGKG